MHWRKPRRSIPSCSYREKYSLANLAPKLVDKICFICSYRFSTIFIPEIVPNWRRPTVTFRRNFLVRVLLRPFVLQRRRAQASAHSAAFQPMQYGQSICLSAASVARARELLAAGTERLSRKSPSAMKLLITPVCVYCPGPLGRIIAQGGSFGLMNSHGSA